MTEGTLRRPVGERILKYAEEHLAGNFSRIAVETDLPTVADLCSEAMHSEDPVLADAILEGLIRNGTDRGNGMDDGKFYVMVKTACESLKTLCG